MPARLCAHRRRVRLHGRPQRRVHGGEEIHPRAWTSRVPRTAAGGRTSQHVRRRDYVVLISIVVYNHARCAAGGTSALSERFGSSRGAAAAAAN